MTKSREEYINQYAEYAMLQMRKYGIPASVTLAQGIIESADGKSMLSRTANNHFGVKGEFNGAYILANDDKPNEKFKKYDNVGQSYEDHSKVLMSDRYRKYCAKLAPDDYRGWASGIKAGGYASSKTYVNTICGIIESANLQKYDKMVMEQARKDGKQIGSADYRNSNTSAKDQSVQTQEQNAKSASNGLYSLPLQREEFLLVTSPFGNRRDPMDLSKTQFHAGIDINCKNEPLLATENNGKIVNVNHNTNTGGGKSVTIEYNRQDGTKYQTTYMHMSAIDVKVGDTVHSGQKIGVSGNTGTRTTGPHLHFEVKAIGEDGTRRNIDPAAYIAEISQKGGLSQQLLCNGKDLLAKYKAENPTFLENGSAVIQQRQEDLSPDGWMKKLLSSEDSGTSLGMGGDPVMEMAMGMFSSLMVLALQIDNKSQEEKMSAVTEAAVSKRIDLSQLVPTMKSCVLMLDESGNASLEMANGNQSIKHRLSNAEMQKIAAALNDSTLSDDVKRQRIAGIISSIGISQQMSQNYELARDQQETQSETLQRR